MAEATEIEILTSALPLEGFLAKVSGSLEADASVWFVYESMESMDRMQGDMDEPITALCPWRFWIAADVIDIDQVRGQC